MGAAGSTIDVTGDVISSTNNYLQTTFPRYEEAFSSDFLRGDVVIRSTGFRPSPDEDIEMTTVMVVQDGVVKKKRHYANLENYCCQFWLDSDVPLSCDPMTRRLTTDACSDLFLATCLSTKDENMCKLAMQQELIQGRLEGIKLSQILFTDPHVKNLISLLRRYDDGSLTYKTFADQLVSDRCKATGFCPCSFPSWSSAENICHRPECTLAPLETLMSHELAQLRRCKNMTCNETITYDNGVTSPNISSGCLYRYENKHVQKKFVPDIDLPIDFFSLQSFFLLVLFFGLLIHTTLRQRRVPS